MKVIQAPLREEWASLCRRGTKPMEELGPLVREVFNAVEAQGDNALLQYTRQFDGVEVNNLEVDNNQLKMAADQVPEDLKRAISLAKENIYTFHKAQKLQGIDIETMPGVRCWQKFQSIEKVGLYIPGGTAPLFSTLLMLAIPAMIAGCKDILICTPPRKDGTIDPVILYTAGLCGVTNIFKVGGIQA
ncbi:MAG: histidinol dehydrogenase, partial [Eudoraea sp.]|nr:histidinol dehydrogenase [Eudoraea sp.]